MSYPYMGSSLLVLMKKHQNFLPHQYRRHHSKLNILPSLNQTQEVEILFP